jgi:fused signal recognition particle receptor
MTTTEELAPLILAGNGYQLEVSPDAETQKAELLKHSALIVEVRDNTAADAARHQVKLLAGMRNLVEKSRKAVKEPVLKIGKDIDAKAAGFVAEITAEESRLSKLIGDHAAEVERQRQEAIRQRQEEERARLAAEAEAKRKAEEAERAAAAAAAEAERARKAAEAAMWEDDDAEAEKAKQEAEKAAAAAEAERQRLAAEKAEQDRMAVEAAEKARQSQLIAATAATAGVKFDLDFEVEDIGVLYAKHPQLVTLTPKRAEILSMLKMLAPSSPDGVPTLAGLKVIKKAKVSTR